MSVSRTAVVQSALNQFENPTYLEIGVFAGRTFHSLKAGRKVAVDPKFQFDQPEWLTKQPNNSYEEITSDAYFATLPIEEKFDVIYLDGLHTFEQTLRDLVNSFSHIHDRSIIIVDDIFPSTLAGALPERREYAAVRQYLEIPHGEWMGDVYKLVLFVDTFCQSWDFRCVQDNHGQMMMWQKPRNEVQERRVEAVGLAGFDRAILDRKSFKFMPLADIVADMKAAFS